jgi:hypothetical protein
VPTVAAGNGEAVVIETVDELNVRVNCFVVVARALSVTRATTVKFPTAVGVPLMVPPALIGKPPGTASADHV